jgi:hypothetical protein
LHAFCKTLGGCPTGEAKLSPGFNLPAKFIIHTVGPVWEGGGFHEKTLLTSCYIRSLELAQQNHCKTVAFPLISAGAYGYPYEEALQIAYDTCQCFLNETKADMKIFIVLYQRGRNYNANMRRHVDYSEFPDADAFQSVANYISEHYHFDAEEAEYEDAVPKKRKASDVVPAVEEYCDSLKDVLFSISPSQPVPEKEEPLPISKQKIRHQEGDLSVGHVAYSSKVPHMGDFRTEETFTQLLIRHMREKNLQSPDVYNDACLDRKLFSKILSNINYQPKKNTAVRLALALQLDPEETDKLLNAAGYALSQSKLTDLVISYCVANNKRTVWEVNGILEDWGLPTI